MIKDLITANRSYRRFHQDEPVDRQTLVELVELARLSPSAANLQPLKYILSADKDTNGRIFPTLAWAGYLKDWPGPSEGERPAAYIIILGDTSISKSFGCDHGIAAQNILLGAVERGLGGCLVGSINRKELSKVLAILDHLEILLVVALGRPAEKIQIETIGEDGSVRYYRDADDIHHVPKRPLDDIILG